MKRIEFTEMPADVKDAIERAKQARKPFGPGARVCIGDRNGGYFAEIELANAEQVSALALELMALGYELTMRREDDCEILLERDASH